MNEIPHQGYRRIFNHFFDLSLMILGMICRCGFSMLKPIFFIILGSNNWCTTCLSPYYSIHVNILASGLYNTETDISKLY